MRPFIAAYYGESPAAPFTDFRPAHCDFAAENEPAAGVRARRRDVWRRGGYLLNPLWFMNSQMRPSQV